jgi:hypothetical protein
MTSELIEAILTEIGLESNEELQEKNTDMIKIPKKE